MEKRLPDEACTVINNIWETFIRSENLLYASCKICEKKIKTTGGNTTGVGGHARLHNIIVKKTERKSKRRKDPAPDIRFKSGDLLANEMSLPAILSRMIAKGGYAFRSFTTDQDLRDCVQARVDALSCGGELPLSDKTIRKYVENFTVKVKTGVMECIQEIKSENQYFSIDFDEWTSIRNRRYIHVTLFTSTHIFWSLGLIRITGNATAERILELVTGRLEEFGVGIKTDIASIITDGAETMKKIGRISGVQQQLCIAHAIQLAVVDLLYVKKKRKRARPTMGLEQESEADQLEEDEVMEEDEEQKTDDDEEELNEDESEEIGDEQDGFDTILEEQEKVTEFNSSDITDAIRAVRDLVVKFKSSPLLTEHLQKYVKVEINDPNEDGSLLLDTRTRWSSLYKMLQRYWEVKNCIEKAVIDLKSPLVVTPKQKFIISCVLKTLEPVEETVRALCCRHSNLIKARVALCQLFANLERHDNPLTKRFKQRLSVRIRQRWTSAAAVVKYLHDRSYSDGIDEVELNQATVHNDYETETFEFSLDYDNDENNNDDWKSIFAIPPKLAIKNFLVDLHSRLIIEKGHRGNLEKTNDVGATTSPPPKKRYKDVLMEALKKSEQASQMVDTAPASQLGRLIIAEMTVFEKTNYKGKYLQTSYDMLMSIKPTSVESERAFSTAGYFCTKIRSRLGDLTLDMLCFMRSFLKNPFAYHDYKLLSITPK